MTKLERKPPTIPKDSDLSLDRVINWNYGESFENFNSKEEKVVFNTFGSNMYNINPKMSEVKDGSCGSGGDVISSSPYPGCKEDCIADENCKGIRYVKNTGQCNLLNDCSNPNKDTRWGYSLKQ